MFMGVVWQAAAGAGAPAEPAVSSVPCGFASLSLVSLSRFAAEGIMVLLQESIQGSAV